MLSRTRLILSLIWGRLIILQFLLPYNIPSLQRVQKVILLWLNVEAFIHCSMEPECVISIILFPKPLNMWSKKNKWSEI
ncbi:unnamed protein product [Lathyrus sativus]|nr:unnamed protein product [Lathyrus sativus]